MEIKYDFIDPSAIMGRLIRNPGYGGPSVGPFGWTWRPEVCKSVEAKPSFHDALARSVATEGIRNPVLVWCFPEGMFLTFGGSRVRAALEAGLDVIPAIINDYTGTFAHALSVTPDNYQTYFTDVPRDVEFTEQGFDYHYNLERARIQNLDPAGLAWAPKDANWISKEFPWL